MEKSAASEACSPSLPAMPIPEIKLKLTSQNCLNKKKIFGLLRILKKKRRPITINFTTIRAF